MNFQSLLAHITTPQLARDEAEAGAIAQQVESANKTAEMSQLRSQWLDEPMTKDIIQFLTISYNYNVNRAKQLAEENSPQVSKYLIQASTIEKVITYARTGNVESSKS